MAPPVKGAVNPPATLPANFFDSSAPQTLPADFDFGATPAEHAKAGFTTAQKTPPSPGLISSAREAFDEAATPPALGTHPGVTGAVHDVADELGAGITGMASPLVHPIKFAQSLQPRNALETIGGPGAVALDRLSAPFMPQKGEDISTYGKRAGGQAISMVPQMATAAMGDEATGVARDIGSATERGGLNLGNAAIGARGPKPFKYGANPARGAFEEGALPSFSRHGAAIKIENALPTAGERVSDAVMAGGNAPLSDLAVSINSPVNEARSIIQGPGGGNRSIEPIEALRSSMERKAPGASAPIYGPHAASASAPDLWRTIQNIDKNTRFNPDPEVEGVNELRRDIRGGLRGNLETAVPGLKSLSQRYGDLKSAQEVLGRTVHGRSGLAEMAKVPMFPLESAAGRGMYTAGKGIQSAAPLAGIAAHSAPLANLLNYIRSQKQ